MFLVQISLLVVTFISLISWVFCHNIAIEVNPHPRIAPRVNMRSVLFFFLCHVELLVHGVVTMLKKSSGRLTCEDGSCVMIP